MCVVFSKAHRNSTGNHVEERLYCCWTRQNLLERSPQHVLQRDRCKSWYNKPQPCGACESLSFPYFHGSLRHRSWCRYSRPQTTCWRLKLKLCCPHLESSSHRTSIPVKDGEGSSTSLINSGYAGRRNTAPYSKSVRNGPPPRDQWKKETSY